MTRTKRSERQELVPRLQLLRIVRTSRAIAATATIVAALSSIHACSSDPEPVDGTSADAAAIDASDARPVATWDSAPYDPPVDDSGPFEGWKRLNEYSSNCGLYYPTEQKYLPAPIEWEPCTVVTDAAQLTDAGLSGPPGMVCERIKPTLSAENTPLPVFINSVHVETDRAYLLIARPRDESGRDGFVMVAEADGPVHTALYNSGTCTTSAADEARFGNVMQRVNDIPGTGGKVGGAIGGAFDQLKPRVYFPSGHQPNPSFAHQYRVGRTLFAEETFPARVYSLGTGELVATIAKSERGPGSLLFRIPIPGRHPLLGGRYVTALGGEGLDKGSRRIHGTRSRQ